MTSRVRIRGMKRLETKIARMNNFLKRGDKSIMVQVGDHVIALIKQRTAMGFDVNLRPFEAYSDAYAKKKGYGTVNLSVSGKMLGDIKKQATGLTARVYIGTGGGGIGSFGIAGVHNFGKGPQPTREFMGLSDGDYDEVMKLIKKLILKAIAKIRS